MVDIAVLAGNLYHMTIGDLNPVLCECWLGINSGLYGLVVCCCGAARRIAYVYMPYHRANESLSFELSFPNVTCHFSPLIKI
jgi:hypothetical protein